jgi:hypothetical protein
MTARSGETMDSVQHRPGRPGRRPGRTCGDRVRAFPIRVAGPGSAMGRTGNATLPGCRPGILDIPGRAPANDRMAQRMSFPVFPATEGGVGGA